MVDTRFFDSNILDVKVAGNNIHHLAGSVAASIERQLCSTVIRLYRNIWSYGGNISGH